MEVRLASPIRVPPLCTDLGQMRAAQRCPTPVFRTLLPALPAALPPCCDARLLAGPADPSPPAGGGMFGRKGRKRPQLTTKDCTSITDGLKRIYFSKARPLPLASLQALWARPPMVAPARAQGQLGGRERLRTTARPPPLPIPSPPPLLPGLRPPTVQIRPLEDVYKFGHFFRRAGAAVRRSCPLRCFCPPPYLLLQLPSRAPAAALTSSPVLASPACSPLLSEGDFEAKPSVLLLGQYSTGGLPRGEAACALVAWTARACVD